MKLQMPKFLPFRLRWQGGLKVTKDFIAHVRQNENGEWITQSILDHLEGTAKKADEFAESFGNSDWAYLIGLWHDLGKFLPAWQKHIRTQSGFDTEAHIEAENGSGKIKHSTAGAVNAFKKLEKAPPLARILAYPIAGYHPEFPYWSFDGFWSNL